MNSNNVYWDWDSMANDHHAASILAIGDSWFWYPFPGGSLVSCIGPLVAPEQHYILAIGNNGAEAFDYVRGKYKNAVTNALNFHGDGLSAVFISGGGNDFAGFNDLRPLLNRDCSAAQSADACFKSALDEFMNKVTESYTLLIGQIMVKCPRDVKIILHNYDYAVPSGKGLFGNDSDWLRPALRDAKVPEALQRECMKTLITRFTGVLSNLCAQGNGQVFLVDSRGTLSDSDWANELHPTPGGFRKIAQQKWAPVLKAQGLAS